MKRKITKEHRVLDDTDLNNINNTFELFKSEFESSREKFKSEFESSRVEFKSGLDKLKSELQSSRVEFKSGLDKFKSELQSTREELRYSREGLNGKLNFILWFIGIGFAVLGILIKMS